MRFELFVAARYLRAKRRQAVIGIITWISIAGVAVGVASLILALAITNGTRRDLQQRLVSSTAHAGLASAAGAIGEAASRSGGCAGAVRAGADLAGSSRGRGDAERHSSGK